MPLESDIEAMRAAVTRVKAEIAKIIVGQDAIVDGVLTALVAGGHVLLEGVPGLGKTLLVRTLAQALDLPYSRIQFTPDLMPADITGTTILATDQQAAERFQFQPGPIFASIVLADEINRATPKTQSALLEAMQEQSVTVGGVQRGLPSPFCVLATQNPIESEGTYPLPEAQLDRFMFKLLVPFPSNADMASILDRTTGTSAATVSKVLDGQSILAMRSIAREVPLASHVRDFAIQIVSGTHPDLPTSLPNVKRFVRFGASPRAAQAIVLAAKFRALLDRRYNVSYDDVAWFALPALRHRIGLSFEGEAEGATTDSVISMVIADARAKTAVKVPA
jgi:MoxR-like ATPase